MRLDGLAQQKPHDHGGQKTNQHIEGKALCFGAASQATQGAADFLPVHQNHRKDGAGLDGDVKHLGLVVVKTQQAARQDEVAGR